MFFNNRASNKLDVLKKTQDNLELTQKNLEMIVAIRDNSAVNANEVTAYTAFKEGDLIESEFSNDDKLRAAYALNLCTVSVSQIIDYNDIHILEQEYDAILNNLNLEKIPKDEALLDILKQLLDTITFFRIQEGDKRLIEKEYQHQMKNAIWSAVPNFGVLMVGGIPLSVGLTLATQVGTGYMNYRRNKAQNLLEKEKKEWELLRSAMEQFNGLRRELFTTAWRLADKYKFPDEYRLTERQIKQYNEILMEVDDVIRYERLESIKDNFIAYPPFWYFFGNAANRISITESDSLIVEKYKTLSIDHYERFIQGNKYQLMREDLIISSCALEYIELLDVENDLEKINTLLKIAEESSGKACDILQLCAMTYIKIGKSNEATRLLKYLVNENYNSTLNAQLLSKIYVENYIQSGISGIDADYRILSRKVESRELFPFPSSEKDVKYLNDTFFKNQRDVLSEKYNYAINSFMNCYGIKFNKVLPTPDLEKDYHDSFFLETPNARNEYFDQVRMMFNNKNKARLFFERLVNSDFSIEYIDVLNEMYTALNELECVESRPHLIETIGCKIENKKDDLNELHEKLNSGFKFDDFKFDDLKILSNLSFTHFTEDFISEMGIVIDDYVQSMDSMIEFFEAESSLCEFCDVNGLDNPDVLLKARGNEIVVYSEKPVYFDTSLLGETLSHAMKIANQRKMMLECTKNHLNLVLKDQSDFGSFILKGDKEFSRIIGKNNAIKKNTEVENTVFGVVKKKNILMFELFLTTEGIYIDSQFAPNKCVKYNDVKFIDNDESSLNINIIYYNKSLNMKEFFNLIQDLAEISSKLN